MPQSEDELLGHFAFCVETEPYFPTRLGDLVGRQNKKEFRISLPRLLSVRLRQEEDLCNYATLCPVEVLIILVLTHWVIIGPYFERFWECR